MDLIIDAHREDANKGVQVTAAAFMAGVAGSGYDSQLVKNVNRPDLDLIWERHQELK